MNLYFLDKNDERHLVTRNVSEEDAIPKMLIDLYNELEMCLRQLGIDAECVVICAKNEEGGIDGEPVLS